MADLEIKFFPKPKSTSGERIEGIIKVFSKHLLKTEICHLRRTAESRRFVSTLPNRRRYFIDL